jgi:hypothetical protein
LKFPSLIARVLSIKSELRANLVSAYRSQDRARLESLLEVIDTLLNAVEDLWIYHRDQIWLSTYKPFGLEIIELRYGGQRTRLLSLKTRIEDFLSGRISRIPEFEVDTTRIYGSGPNLFLDFARSYTPARALGTG